MIKINIEKGLKTPLTVAQNIPNQQIAKDSVNANKVRFQLLLEELVRKKGVLTKEQVLALIEDKKKKVGGGYLTDQGSLFLVAADLGVTLSYNNKDISLENVGLGQKEVNFVARVMSIGGPKKLDRSTEQKTEYYCKMILYDETSFSSITLWDQMVDKVLDAKLQLGSAIKISKANVRPGLNGSLWISIGNQATIEPVPQDDVGLKIPKIEERLLSPTLIQLEANFLVVRGQILSDPKRTEFLRRDGSRGSLHSFSLVDQGNETNPIRVVMWEYASPLLEKLSRGETVTLLNLKSKKFEQPGKKYFELHGNEMTCILERWVETLQWYKQSLSDIARKGLTNEEFLDSSRQTSSINLLPFVARVLSIGKARAGEPLHILIVDSYKRKIDLIASGEALGDIETLQQDDILVCRPESFDQSGLKVNCGKRGAILKTKSKREDIPKSISLLTSIEGLQAGSQVTVDVMALGDSVTKDVTTKEGPVRRTEISVGDPTGEINAYSWRNLTQQLEKIQAGAKLTLQGFEVQSYEGRRFLLLKNYSRVLIKGN